MAGQYRLRGGSHTRENGEQITAGQTFTPTQEELDGPLRGRVSPAASGYVTVPADAWERIFGPKRPAEEE